MFDYLIVGAGLFGATLAHYLTNAGRTVLVVEKKTKVGGTVRTECIDDIYVHKYGAHIFRTNDSLIWDYVNEFDTFVPFINSPLAIHNDTVYNLPFNMNTFSKLWDIRSPEEAKAIIHKQICEYGLVDEPKNLEEFALSTVGRDIYEAFIKEYSEKQWGRPCVELPPDTMKRIPLRFTYDNNYYDVKYQGIPTHGYSYIIDKMLCASTVFCGVDGRKLIEANPNICNKIIYTGCIDEYYNYQFSPLEYRSLRFEHERWFDIEDYQGNAVVNYSDKNVEYTRIIEHKHFLRTKCPNTITTREYPAFSGDPYYPIDDEKNRKLYNKYLALAERDNIIFAGRLGSYKYYDMSDTISEAFNLFLRLAGEEKK